MTDFAIAHHGSICILTPLTKEAKVWVDDNLPDDALSWCGGVAIEPRYVDSVIDGIATDGLSLA